LSTPTQHLCQRCFDKIEWRKNYRKYKPRTQPGTCNLCRRRNVLAAYHTICTNCTVSEKAHQVLQELRLGGKKEETAVEEGSAEEEDPSNETKVVDPPQSNLVNEEMMEAKKHTTASVVAQLKLKEKIIRVCAMCVKDEALPDNDEKDTIDEAMAKLGRISLRQRRAIERGLLREQDEEKKRNDGSEGEEEEPNHEEEEFSSDFENDSTGDSNQDSDEEDPFLKAVGGADKLLTGEAYQDVLLQKESL